MPPVKSSNLPFTVNIIDPSNNILVFADELANASTILQIAKLCQAQTPSWTFESLADLCDWRKALDNMDAAL
eukprot:CAMPEP_0118639100 /NCGR_PEP_ID=MMETSP0785-20121206/4046_1 /TAXON_ID=91992 /ORGANISM="Bolidomonas pacifica, Strain CCMP 1866" /LENGTH=71 /DNA_ID=CAMNT_0006530411 /DNA_START=108 /DNA_END=320 /DNA_ORIENTATION=-